VNEFDIQAVGVAGAIAPVLATIGFDKVKRFTAKGIPFRVHFMGQDPLGFDMREGVDLFVTDAYPDQNRSEAFLFTWTSIGSSSKHIADKIVTAMKKAGIEARRTTRRGDHGVAFKTKMYGYE
jgi:hypothetical protein